MRKLVLLTAVLLASVTFTYAQFTFTSIDYPGGTSTVIRGINNRGDMAGGYTTDPNQEFRHALLIKNGKFIPLAPATVLGTGPWSDAYKMNDRGDVVGVVCDDVACHGFLLSKKGGLTILDFPGATDTYAAGINDSGTISGYWDLYDANGNYLFEQGFLWKDGTFTETTYPGSGDTAILGINRFGDSVGIWDTGPTATIYQGFVFSKGQFTSFDAPYPGVVFTQGDDINGLGLIVGQEYSAHEYATGFGHGFLAVGEDFFTRLDYPCAAGTTAWGINLFLQIVGSWYDSNYTAHGWLAQLGGEGKPCSSPDTLKQGRSKIPTMRHTPATRPRALATTR